MTQHNSSKQEEYHSPGTLTTEVYERQLSRRRFALRQLVLSYVEFESGVIARWQNEHRTPARDRWFRASALLGTTSFFVSTIPLFFFFGYAEAGRRLLYILGWGGYLTSLLKDTLCIPRPRSPPVTRLTTGFHHLEYGMPSTHSAHCVSTALFLYSLSLRHIESDLGMLMIKILLVTYAGSVVLGRIYCGMHSVSDCVAGSMIGVLSFFAVESYGGLFEDWAVLPSYHIPLSMFLTSVALLGLHPTTVERCLCFDDAIACLSSMLGVIIGRWFAVTQDFPPPLQPSNHSSISTHPLLIHSAVIAFLKIVVGVGALLLWRLTVKATLPKLLATTSHGSHSATDSTGSMDRDKSTHLDPVPSVVDLTSAHKIPESKLYTARRRSLTRPDGAKIKLDVSGTNAVVGSYRFPLSEVIVKVTVYFGIGWLGSVIIPHLFEQVGWS